jgi:hypothetical protein
VEVIQWALTQGIRPHVISIAAHYGVTPQSLRKGLIVAGVVRHRWCSSEVDRAAHRLALPSVRLATQEDWRLVHQAEVLHDAPPLHELEDSCARWGIDGAAEEYDVPATKVCAWLSAYGKLHTDQ